MPTGKGRDDTMNLPSVPLNFNWDGVKRWMLEVHKQLDASVVPQPIPDPISNLRIIPGPGMNRIEWTMSNADGYIVLISPTPTWTSDNGWYADAGTSNYYVDHAGKSGELRYYWVRPKTGQVVGQIVGPVSGTTLGLGTNATLPANTVPITTTQGQATDTGNISVGKFRAQRPINS